MLSYPLLEARELLESKLSGAKTKISESEEDLGFLREQITVWALRKRKILDNKTHVDPLQTLEVATARVYNWDVGQRRREKAEAEAEKKEKNKSSEADAPEWSERLDLVTI